MINESMLMQGLGLSCGDFDKAWSFCKSFSFKLQPHRDGGLAVALFTMQPDCSIIETKIEGRDSLLLFFKNPTPYILKSIASHKLRIARVDLYEGEAKTVGELTMDHNFYIYYCGDGPDQRFELNSLLCGAPEYRVAWAHWVINGEYDKDRDYDTCFEMNDGAIINRALNFLKNNALQPTVTNIKLALASGSQPPLF